MDLTRRGFIASATAAAAAPWGAAIAQAPGDVRFRVLRDGSEIGTHIVTFSRAADRLNVRTNINLQVRVAFITAFRYQHDAEETWQGDRLLQANSQTNDNGTKYQVIGAAVADGFRTMGPAGPFVTRTGTLTSDGAWNPRFVDQSVLINLQEGGEMGLVVTKLGTDVQFSGAARSPATKYQIVTPQCAGVLWYDKDRGWIRAELEIKGEKVIYERA